MTGDEFDIRLTLFGGPELRIGERTVRLSPLQAALLGVVFGNRDDSVSRQAIVETLWADGSEPRRRRRLNQLLYSFKARTGGTSLFIATQDHISPASDSVACDLRALETAIDTGDFARLQTPRRGTFLQNLSGFPVDRFQDWMGSRSRELVTLERNALLKGWSDAELAADWAAAKELGASLLVLGPPEEPLLRRALEAFVRVGCLEEAEGAISDFRQRYEDETGTPWVPSAEIRESVDKLRSQGGHERIDHSFTDPPSHQVTPFCGRALASG